MQTEAKTSYTYADYAKLPEGAPYQLIQGKLVMSPAPTTFHQIIVLNLARRLQDYVEARKLGMVLVSPVDVYLTDTNTFQPDVVFVRADRLTIIGEQKLEGAPDLVVEVLSPSTAYYDLRQKRSVYAEAGVPEYWIIDPEEKSVETYELHEGALKLAVRFETDGEIRSRVVDGFSMDWAAIFDKGLLNPD